MHELHPKRRAIGAPQNLDDLPHCPRFETEHIVDEDRPVEVVGPEAVAGGVEFGLRFRFAQPQRVEIGSQMAAHSVGPDDHQGADGIERLPPHLDAAPCRSALARPSLRPLCCLWARSFVLPIAVERRNHFAVAGEHALIAPPWRVL